MPNTQQQQQQKTVVNKTTRLLNRRNGTRRESSIFHDNVLIMFPALDSILCYTRFFFKCFTCVCALILCAQCSCIVLCISIHCSMHTGCHLCLLQFVSRFFLYHHGTHTHTHTKIHSTSFPGHSPKNSMENLDFSFVLPSLTFSFLLSLCSFYHNNFDRKKRLPFFINVNHFFFSVLTSYVIQTRKR